MKGNNQAETKFQEVVALREHGWEGLPLPPMVANRRLNPTGAGQGDPAATPVATPLGLHRDLEPQTPQTPPLESITATEGDVIPAFPITHSPSTSIATLSDFTIADASDDEGPIDPAILDASATEPLDPTDVILHETFYLDDGNVEVLCRNTLFRVHASTLSFHSPALRRMFARTSLIAADSPNGCPRIQSSDSATDFFTLLNVVYLPEYATWPHPNEFFR